MALVARNNRNHRVKPENVNGRRLSRYDRGFTLAEVVISMAYAALITSGIIYGYTLSVKRAEWAANSTAAQALAKQRMEQTRSAKWDYQSYPAIDQVLPSSFPVVTNVLDTPVSGTNSTLATVTTTITVISTNPPMKMVRVDCVWRAATGRQCTNTVATYRAPDN